MDPAIRAIIHAGAALRADALAESARLAREGKKRKRDERRAQEEVPKPAQVALVAVAVPGAAAVLGLTSPTPQEAPIGAISRLAFSPKIRGSGREIDRVRKLQQFGCALVGSAALQRQSHGLRLMCSKELPPHSLRGCAFMFDEATQKARGLLSKLKGMDTSQMRSQKLVEFMVVLSSVLTASIDGQWAWQPWLCAPVVMDSTKAVHLWSGLNKVLPIDFDSTDSIAAFCKGVDIALVTACTDFASSNISCLTCMQDVIAGLPPPDPGHGIPAMHTERCLTHALHIVKASALSTVSVASNLFAISKVVAHSRSLDHLSNAIEHHIAARLQVVDAPPADAQPDALFDVLKVALGLDGDDSMLYRQVNGRKHYTAWVHDIEQACQKCLFSRASGKWLYVHTGDPSSPPSADAMASHIAGPLQKILVQRRWEVAALNRWSGTIRCLKRFIVGTIFNKVLPESLARLSGRMDLDEQKVAKKLKEWAERQIAGDDANDDCKWLQHCRRIVRLSVFSRRPAGAGRWGSC